MPYQRFLLSLLQRVFLAPPLAPSPSGFTFLLFGAVPFVAGRTSARLGLQDRFFFMPIWWIGMLGMSTMGLIPLGVPDYLAWIPGVIGIGLLHPYYKAKLEKRLWEKAVAKCQDLSDADSQKRFWKQIKNVLFFPEKIPASDAIIQHNLTLIERMRQRVAGGKEVETLAYETLSVLEGLLQLQAQTIKVDPDTLSDEERKKVAELNRTTLESGCFGSPDCRRSSGLLGFWASFVGAIGAVLRSHLEPNIYFLANFSDEALHLKGLLRS